MSGRPAALLLLAGLAHASAPDLFGYGARAEALAGAATSSASGHAAVLHNAGALAFDTRPTFSVGYQRAELALTLNDADHDARAATATFLGFGLPLPFGGFLKDRIALGAAFVIPTNSVLVADVPRPDEPRFVLVEARAQTVSLSGALAVRITEWLGVGAGFLALSELEGAIDVAPNQEGRIGSQARDQLVAAYAPLVGMQLNLPWTLRFGAEWRDESSARFTLPITADLGEGFTIPVPTLNVVGVAQYDPMHVAAELSGRAAGILLAGGATWKRWSAFPNPIEYTAVPADYPAQPEPDFEDTVELRLGAERPFEVGPTVLTARAGYQYAPTPAPEQAGLHSYLDSDRHLVAAGFGVAWSRLRFDAALQWHHLAERTHTKADGAELVHSGDIYGFSLEAGIEL